jgi:hypothetical protein
MRQQTHAASPRERLNLDATTRHPLKRGWRSTKILRLLVRVSGKVPGSQSHGQHQHQHQRQWWRLSTKISLGTIRDTDCELDYRYRNPCPSQSACDLGSPACCNAGNKSRSGPAGAWPPPDRPRAMDARWLGIRCAFSPGPVPASRISQPGVRRKGSRLFTRPDAESSALIASAAPYPSWADLDMI